MSNRVYRAVLGFLILLGLYYDLEPLIFFVIALLAFEGLTNLKLTDLLCKLQNSIFKGVYHFVNPEEALTPRFNIEAEQVWRLVVSAFLYLCYVPFDMFWFLPWFMGLVIFGSGLSGVCPGLLVMRWIGFR